MQKAAHDGSVLIAFLRYTTLYSEKGILEKNQTCRLAKTNQRTATPDSLIKY